MNDEQMDALIETLESWGERADMPLSAIGSMHKAAKALTETRAELAELRARVPAICFPRQPNGEGGWVIDANYVAAIHKDCFPIEWQPCEEEVEAVLLAVERAAPVPQPAVPEAVAKDAIPTGWVFYSADASIQSSDPRRPIGVMLKRDVDGVQWWLQLTEEEKEKTQLYSSGSGMTLTLAIQNAAAAILSAADDKEVKNGIR